MAGMEPKRAVLGVDFGASNLKALLVDSDARVYERFIEPSEPELGPEHVLKRIVALVNRARRIASTAGLPLTDVGIGVCAPVNHSKGELVESALLPGWRDVPVKAAVERETGLRVCLDNDANAAILGEWWQGAGERCAIVAGLTLGTGIGGGLIINGRVYRGGWGFGGEFGHISVASEPDCRCGGKGCLGRLASATDTLRRYYKLAGEDAVQVEGMRGLARIAGMGDKAAQQSIAVSADYLAKGILILVNVLNPDVFVLAGGMSLAGDMLLNPISDYIRSSTFKTLGENTRICAARLDLYSGCYGSAWLALSGDRSLP